MAAVVLIKGYRFVCSMAQVAGEELRNGGLGGLILLYVTLSAVKGIAHRHQLTVDLLLTIMNIKCISIQSKSPISKYV